jgi:ribosomal protein S8
MVNKKAFSTNQFANFFSSLQNAMMVNRLYCFVPYNKDILLILKLFYDLGLIKKFYYNSEKSKKIKIYLKYKNNNTSLIFKFVNIFIFDLKFQEIKKFIKSSNYDYFLLSTSKGLTVIQNINDFNKIGGILLYGIILNK